jgi:hypothetical protein
MQLVGSRSSKAVETDAQGRPHLRRSVILGRRLFLRYVS